MFSLMESLGETFLPYQRAFIEDAMMVDEEGEYVAREACLNLPRQCGKTFAGIARVLYGALVEEEELICLSSHQQATSRESFKNIVAYFENFNDLSRRVRRVVSAIGRESIDLKNGVSIRFPSRTRQSTRGWSVNLLAVDECQLLTDCCPSLKMQTKASLCMRVDFGRMGVRRRCGDGVLGSVTV